MASRDGPEWFTLGQAARFLGVAQSTIRAWSDSGRVPTFYTPGRHRRYRRHDLEAFVERSRSTGGRVGPVVLLAEDDESVRNLVRAALELEGYAVSTARNADEATGEIEARRPDLILLDVRMPHVDGWEILRRAQCAAAAIPVVTFGAVEGVGEGVGAARRDVADATPDVDRLLEQARQVLSGNPRSYGTGPP